MRLIRHFPYGAALPLLAILSAPAQAQLRPWDPFDWSSLERDTRYVASFGAGTLWNQRASLAGTSGTLGELGAYRLQLRTGRVVIDGAGTVYRILKEADRFAQPFGDARQGPLGYRRDAGDHRITTAVRLTPDDVPGVLILRFGTRLPTTDNEVGLERDATDFYALLGGRLDRGRARFTAEAGVGIHGTRFVDYEQSDVFVYVLGAEWRTRPAAAAILLLGHADGVGWTVRGNEPLSEVRARARTSGPAWIQLELLKGLTSFSPTFGLTLLVGATR